MRIGLLVACATLLFPAVAFPCGGFFCSGGGGLPPVVQTGEKILFSVENGQVTAHVQILYAGEPRAFAWVVPVPSQPTLSVGSDQLFTLLDNATTPSFSVRWQNSCYVAPLISCGCAGAVPVANRGVYEDGGSAGGVDVVSQGAVGPFETAVLASSDPTALGNWLTDAGFDFPPSSERLIAPYVEKKNYFVALKLQADKGIGDLQPIVLKFASEAGPCVPIRLTAVAAQANLGIAVFLLGEGRGVPTNYQHLILNESRIDWTGNPIGSYPAAVTAAADEAGGQGFVTDYAGPSSTVAATIAQSISSYSRTAVSTTDPIAFVKAVRDERLLGTSQNVLGILSHCVPQPAATGSTPLSFYSNIELWSSYVTQATVEQPRCGDEIDTLVVEPLRQAVAAMGRLPTLTRLYTTLSADEMTLDPEFAFNRDLPMVPAAHVVNGQMLCDGSRPVRADLTGSDGHKFSLPWGTTNSGAPALLRAEQLSASGEPKITKDNTQVVNQANQRSMVGCGCMAGGGGAVALGIALMLLAARRRV